MNTLPQPPEPVVITPEPATDLAPATPNGDVGFRNENVVSEDEIRPSKFPVDDKNFQERLSEFLKNGAKDAPGEPKQEQKPEAKVEPTETKKPEEPVKNELPKADDPESDESIEADVKKFTKNLPPEAASSFKHLRYQNRDLKRQLTEAKTSAAKVAELETKLSEAQSNKAAESLQKELEVAKARLTEQETELAASRIEATEVFRKEVAEPLNAVETELDRIAKEYDLKKEAIFNAMALTGRARAAALEELLVELPTFDKDAFISAIRQHGALTQKATEMRGNAKAHYDRIMQEQRESKDRFELEQKTAFKTAIEKTWNDKILKHAPFVKEEAGNEDWNQRVKYANDWARSFDINAVPSEDRADVLAEMNARSATWPLLVGKIQALENENAQLKTRNQSLKAASPSSGNGSVNSLAPTPEVANKNKTLEERFKEEFHALVR